MKFESEWTVINNTVPQSANQVTAKLKETENGLSLILTDVKVGTIPVKKAVVVLTDESVYGLLNFLNHATEQKE